MSVDINWEKLTGGPDGLLLAESIRHFLHDKFQQMTLPRFIREVKVHAFEFGRTPPEIQIKDICDPLPDFYEEDEDDDDDDGEDDRSSRSGDEDTAGDPSTNKPGIAVKPAMVHSGDHVRPERRGPALRSPVPYGHFNAAAAHQDMPGSRSLMNHPSDQLLSPFLQRSPTPGIIPGGTSNINYFHLPLSAGLSGTATPLAAVAGAQLQTAWGEHHHPLPHHHYHHQLPARHPHLDVDPRQHDASISSSTPASIADPGSRPPSQHHNISSRSSRIDVDDAPPLDQVRLPSPYPTQPLYEPGPMDIQVVSHVKYNGDVKIVLTAEIHMDYPMQNFVGIPLKLTVTGLSFDGVAILAHIKKRAHFCFLSPDDATAVLSTGSDPAEFGKANPSGVTNANKNTAQSSAKHHSAGALLEHIKVESEIGQKDDGRQVLKNVGKVESFVLDRIRRIFEEELVYPSFWTILV
jgi:mitochondrial distribution and morphology protein 12